MPRPIWNAAMLLGLIVFTIGFLVVTLDKVPPTVGLSNGWVVVESVGALIVLVAAGAGLLDSRRP